MARPEPTRREFIADSAGALGGAWLWLRLPSFGLLAACARDAARTEAPPQALTPDEFATLRAVAARLLPSDEASPGAEEAGAAWFVDAALTTHFPALLEPVRGLLSSVDERARVQDAARFARLDAARQDALLRDVETDPGFGPTRTLVLAGVFSDPVHGGNRNSAAEQILGYRHEGVYQPPFGYYDAEAGRSGGGAP